MIFVTFYGKFIKLCNDAGLTPSKAATNAGISKAAVSGWKAGRQNPTDANMAKIADYFGVPLSYFTESLDEKEEKLPVDTDKELSSKYSDWQILAAYEKADDNVKEAILLLLKLR